MLSGKIKKDHVNQNSTVSLPGFEFFIAVLRLDYLWRRFKVLLLCSFTIGDNNVSGVVPFSFLRSSLNL